MRKIAATYVFPVSSPPIKNGIIVIDDDGKILDLIDTKGKLTEQSELEYYNGIIVPGFVNAHCHLELSHLKNKIKPNCGLGNFIGDINKLRKAEDSEILNAAFQANKEMQNNGIVAVGDISNNALSVSVKKESRIKYHSFIEVFGFLSERAERAFSFARKELLQFELNGLAASIVPHSPYSVSDKLFELIRTHSKNAGNIISIHNQESIGENQFYQNGDGEIAYHLKNNIGLDISEWKPTGKNSLQSIFHKLPKNNSILLVHNTFTSEEDLKYIINKTDAENLFFVLCPNANIYISNCLPPVDLFKTMNLNICLGTDSLASNYELSILSEMKIIQQNFPEVSLSDLFLWATKNGARALHMDNHLGSFEKGKTPGINLITKSDLINLKLTPESKVKRLA